MKLTDKTRPSWFWLLASVGVPGVWLMTKTSRIHKEKLPREGAFVLAVNHYSEFDPLVSATAIWRMGRAPRFMIKESLFRVPVLGLLLRMTGMIPIARVVNKASLKSSFSAAETIVERGSGVIVCPEGTLTRDPDLWPMRGKSGAVRIALEANIPLIPAAQWGAAEIMPRYGKFRLFPFRKPTSFIVGDPIDLSPYVGKQHDPAALAEATELMMNSIADLLSELRGEPAPEKRWDPSEHGQAETGRL